MDRLQLCALQIDIISRIGPRPAAFPRIGILISPSASFLRSFLSLSLSFPLFPPLEFLSTLVYSSLIKEPRRREGEGGKRGKEGRRSTRECVPYGAGGVSSMLDVGRTFLSRGVNY